MTVSVLHSLARFGPDRCDAMSEDDARAWCRRLAVRHRENFHVLSQLVPADLRDDFAAVYAFCRWADDLGDETGDPEQSLKLLGWWRGELQSCFDGTPRHPVFTALLPTVRRHDLPIEPFDHLIRAFEQDQEVRRYDTWIQLREYCRRSADPVGRLVLMIFGEPRSDELFALSDAICTALQLTNHWQDVRRDILDRDRIYVPADMIHIDQFEDRLVRTARRGWAADPTFLDESRRLVRTCVERTWPLFRKGEALLDRIRPQARPVVWLFLAGGRHVLRKIELWNHETVLHRPTLGVATRVGLVAQAWLASKVAARRKPA